MINIINMTILGVAIESIIVGKIITQILITLERGALVDIPCQALTMCSIAGLAAPLFYNTAIV